MLISINISVIEQKKSINKKKKKKKDCGIKKNT